MKQKAISFYRILLGALMGLLGFGSCAKSDTDPDDYRVMYGQPTATYKFTGTVKDEAGKPIKGIRVVFHPDSRITPESESFKDYCKYEVDTLYTNDKGEFSTNRLKYDGITLMNETLVVFDDVDGAAGGGEFQSVSLDKNQVSVKVIEKKEGWNTGTYGITANAVLKKKD